MLKFQRASKGQFSTENCHVSVTDSQLLWCTLSLVADRTPCKNTVCSQTILTCYANLFFH